MASGLPTAVFDYHVNREILGNLGIYARPGDSHSLAKAILDCIFDKEKCARLSKRLREKAVKEYSWERVAEKVTEVYRKVSG
jgi:glycosyltransferase involved in cell wall biosynthesis